MMYGPVNAEKRQNWSGSVYYDISVFVLSQVTRCNAKNLFDDVNTNVHSCIKLTRPVI